MFGAYQSREDGSLGVSVQRDRLGEITSVEVLRSGDVEFDRRTR